MTTPLPVSLSATPTTLTIQWADGVTHALTWERLRANCPCAFCRKDREKPPVPEKPANPFNILPPGASEPIRALRMEPLGNYAYHIDFSDGHRSGIYSFDLLRTLGRATA
jgi:ATP-binding protein involved in chromosome partitioning